MNSLLENLVETREFQHRGRRYPFYFTAQVSGLEKYAQIIVENNLRSGLEIGTLFGLSTLYLADAFAKTGGKLVSVDIRPKNMKWVDGAIIEDIHEAAENLIREAEYEDIVEFVEGNSLDVLPAQLEEGREYDFAHIDGDHKYEVALLDFISTDRMMKVGGYIALDDTGSKIPQMSHFNGGPNRLLATIFASNRYEIVPVTNNQVVCRKVRHIPV